MEPSELLMTAARAVAVYALMLGEIVDEIIYRDVTFAQGTIAIITVASLQYANSWMSYWNHGMDKVLEGSPSIVVRHGRLQRDGMRKERMNDKDVMAELRLQGIAELDEVRLAAIENDGQMSVVREDWAEPLQKGDVGAADKAKPGTTENEKDGEPARRRRTDSPDALG